MGDNPADIAALRIDFAAWWPTLTAQQQFVFVRAIGGESTPEIAEALGVSKGRVSQIRRALVESWERFTF
jgi:DNA-directed RNA polymerase specialized sigma24 family protein